LTFRDVRVWLTSTADTFPAFRPGRLRATNRDAGADFEQSMNLSSLSQPAPSAPALRMALLENALHPE
jgi:hypothetical protein